MAASGYGWKLWGRICNIFSLLSKKKKKYNYVTWTVWQTKQLNWNTEKKEYCVVVTQSKRDKFTLIKARSVAPATICVDLDYFYSVRSANDVLATVTMKCHNAKCMALLLSSEVHGANPRMQILIAHHNTGHFVLCHTDNRMVLHLIKCSSQFVLLCHLLFTILFSLSGVVLPVQREWLKEVQKLKYKFCVSISAFTVVLFIKQTNAARVYCTQVCFWIVCCFSIRSLVHLFARTCAFVFIFVLLICIFDCIIYSSFTLVWL